MILEAEIINDEPLEAEIITGGNDSPSDVYKGEYTVTPGPNEQILKTKDLVLRKDVTVKAIPDEYVIPKGTLEVTENGVQDVTTYESVAVAVPMKEEQSKELTITENGKYSVLPDENKVLSKVDVRVDTPEPKEEEEQYWAIGANGRHIFEPTAGKVLSRVTVDACLPYADNRPKYFVDVAYGENGEYTVLAEEAKVLSGVNIKVNVPTGGDTEAIEQIIDESGVLDSTEGTVEEKVEQLVEEAEDADLWYIASGKLTTLASNINPIFTSWQYSKLPRFDFSNIKSMSYAVCNTQLESIDYYINSGKCTNFSDAFSSNKELKYMVGFDSSSATTLFDLCMACSVLETIQEPINMSKVTNARFAFQECFYLKDILFVEESIKVSIGFPHSKDLTAESIQSIIDGLAYVETAQTLTLHKNIELTDEQKATIYNKGWTLAQ